MEVTDGSSSPTALILESLRAESASEQRPGCGRPQAGSMGVPGVSRALLVPFSWSSGRLPGVRRVSQSKGRGPGSQTQTLQRGGSLKRDRGAWCCLLPSASAGWAVPAGSVHCPALPAAASASCSGCGALGSTGPPCRPPGRGTGSAAGCPSVFRAFWRPLVKCLHHSVSVNSVAVRRAWLRNVPALWRCGK